MTIKECVNCPEATDHSTAECRMVRVPRELLERVAKPVETQYDRDQRWKALQELRALLTEQPQASAAKSAPATVAAGHMREVLAMVLRALDRDAAEGRILRGEMAAELRAAMEAQSAPAGAVECMHFEYRHPDSGERRTVTITRQDVADGMEDTLFEKLCEQICRCEPVGETNVVECNCSDYTDDFQLLAAAPAQPAAQEPYPHDHPLHKAVFMARESYTSGETFEEGVHGLIAELKEARQDQGEGEDQGEVQRLREALTMFVHLAESRLRELGDLSPEMAECLNKGRDALLASTGQEG